MKTDFAIVLRPMIAIAALSLSLQAASETTAEPASVDNKTVLVEVQSPDSQVRSDATQAEAPSMFNLDLLIGDSSAAAAGQ